MPDKCAIIATNESIAESAREICAQYALSYPVVTSKSNAIAVEMAEKFGAYPWLGNIRELENALERLTIIQKEKVVAEAEIETVLKDMRLQEPSAAEASSMAELEKRAILDTLHKTGGDRSKTCKILGISQVTLWRRLKEWNVQFEGKISH